MTGLEISLVIAGLAYLLIGICVFGYYTDYKRDNPLSIAATKAIIWPVLMIIGFIKALWKIFIENA